MSIDITKEEVFLLKVAGKKCTWANPKGVPYSTILQWSKEGIAGVRLEVLRTPMGQVTSMAAIQAFLLAITAAANDETNTPIPGDGTRRLHGATNGQGATAR